MSINENEDLTQALEVLVDRQPPAGPPPTAELLRRGRLGRRRRAAVMTGGVAAVAAVAMAGAFAAGIGGGSPTASGLGPAAGSSGKPTSTTSPSGKPTSTSSPSGKPTSTGSPSTDPTNSSPSGKPSDAPTAGPLVPEMLAERVPAGYRILATWKDPGPKPGSGKPWRIGVAHTITNGPRTGTIRIELTQVVGVPSGSTDYKPTADCGTAPACTVTHRPDGSLLMVTLPAAAAGLQDWQATLYGTDGSMVTASSSTVPAPGGGTDLYSGPPILNGEQLTALALDPVWQGVIKKH
ncbi:hypothetical protein [Kitasatospora griseola]|uniref:hypothetical protein n=1 Tax=Kitasatospora griseola TaxID=2064 RepID=UPI00342F25BA